jgi:hypothetical protein
MDNTYCPRCERPLELCECLQPDQLHYHIAFFKDCGETGWGVRPDGAQELRDRGAATFKDEATAKRFCNLQNWTGGFLNV